MSLTNDDLVKIREIVGDVFDRKIEPVLGELEALRNDILRLNNILVSTAKRLGV